MIVLTSRILLNSGKDPTKWYPGDPGWPLHLCSTISEWIMALAFNTFLLTFVIEFKKVKLDSPQVVSINYKAFINES